MSIKEPARGAGRMELVRLPAIILEQAWIHPGHPWEGHLLSADVACEAQGMDAVLSLLGLFCTCRRLFSH